MSPRLTDVFTRRLARAAHPRRMSALLRCELLERRDTPTGIPVWAVGAAAGDEPRVRVYDADGQQVTSFLAYESTFTGGVRVATADLNGDGTPDIVTAAGPGGGPRVRVFDGATGAAEADFLAYESTFTGGVWVTAGPIGNGQVGIATGADAGGGSRVRVFGADGTGTQDFFAFDTGFTGGVRVALGQSGGTPNVYAASGPGMAPTLRGFDVATASQRFEQSAGDESETGGVWVTAGDLLGGRRDDVVTASGSGSDTELRLFDGAYGLWANQVTVSGSADGLGVVNWGGERAVGVLDGGTVSTYTLGGSFGDAATLHDQVNMSGGGSAGSFGGTVSSLPVGNQDALTADWVFAGLPAETVTVTTTVDMDPPGYPNQYLWKYHVHNNDFDEAIAQAGAGHFVIYTDQSSLISDMGNSLGWSQQIGDLGDDTVVKWSQSLGSGPLDPGADADFWFTTPAMAVTTGSGDARDPGEASRANGAALVPANGPRIVITDRDANAIGQGGLKVAKWQDAFQMNAAGTDVEIKGPTAGTNLDFIDRDPDRFNVWVYDKAAWDAQTAHIQAKISTTNVVGFTNYDDAATAVDLVRYAGAAKNEPGWYWSDSQMLVSNKVDDELSAAAYLGADEAAPGAAGLPKSGSTWQVSDRTHRIALRGTVKAEYTAAGVTVSASAPVPVTKVVNLYVNVLRDKEGGREALAKTEVISDITRMREIYTQVGILVNAEIKNAANPPFNLENGLPGYSAFETVTNPNGTKVGYLTPTFQEEALLGASSLWALTGANNTDKDVSRVYVYYVNKITMANDEALGEAFAAAQLRPEERYQRYADSVIVSAGRNYGTLAHEVFHVLENRSMLSADGKIAENHYPYTLPVQGKDKINLMVSGPNAVRSNLVVDSRRLTVSQEVDAYSKRTNLVIDPKV